MKLILIYLFFMIPLLAICQNQEVDPKLSPEEQQQMLNPGEAPTKAQFQVDEKLTGQELENFLNPRQAPRDATSDPDQKDSENPGFNNDSKPEVRVVPTEKASQSLDIGEDGQPKGSTLKVSATARASNGEAIRPETLTNDLTQNVAPGENGQPKESTHLHTVQSDPQQDGEIARKNNALQIKPGKDGQPAAERIQDTQEKPGNYK